MSTSRRNEVVELGGGDGSLRNGSRHDVPHIIPYIAPLTNALADARSGSFQVDACEYEVVCPNTILGCDHSCSRSSLTEHLENCRFGGECRGPQELLTASNKMSDLHTSVNDGLTHVRKRALHRDV